MKEWFYKCREIIIYLICGVATTVVNWLVYSVFVVILGSVTWNVTASNIISWIAAVAFAFVTNKICVFQSRSWSRNDVWPELWKFVSARIATGIIEIVGVPLLVAIGMDWKIFGIEGSLAKVLVSVVVVILNYVFSKWLVFRTRMDK